MENIFCTCGSTKYLLVVLFKPVCVKIPRTPGTNTSKYPNQYLDETFLIQVNGIRL